MNLGIAPGTVYSTLDAVNASTLKRLWSHSPKHYRHLLDHPMEPTPSMSLGSAAHCAILEPEQWDARYLVRPADLDGRTKEGKAWMADARASGREILTAEQSDAAHAMAASVKTHPVAARYLARGAPEQAFAWTDAETGVRCKGRADWLDSGLLLDLKTAREVKPAKFASQAAALGYHLQLAFYLDGLETLGNSIGAVIMIAVESSPPHDCVVYELDDDILDCGRYAYREALIRLRECRECNYWPGYADGELVRLVLPKWARPGDEEDLHDTGLDFGAEVAA